MPEKLEESDNIIVFNIEHAVEAMFYTDYLVYDFAPSVLDIVRLQSEGYSIVIHDDGKLEKKYEGINDVVLINLNEKAH